MRRLLATGMLGLLLPALLSACGFHLRQAPDFPPSMRRIYVAAPGQSGQLLRELRRTLSSDKTEILDTPEGATATLSIISVQQTSRPLAVDSAGDPLEYQVIYGVEFSLIVQGVTVLEPQTLNITRNYAYSATNQVANEEQEQALGQAMAKDVSQFISFRLAAAAKNLPPEPVTTVAPVPATRPVPAPDARQAPAMATQTVPPAASTPPAV